MYNKSMKDPEVRATIREMHYKQGMSGAAIGTVMGIAPRTVYDYLAGNTWNGEIKLQYNPEDASFSSVVVQRYQHSSPKVLLIDIETSPILGAVWGLFNNNLSLNQIEKDWYILSFAAKWLDEDEVFYKDKRDTWDNEDDLELLEDIHKLLSEADWVIAQNGVKFDVKKINARFVLNGMKPPSSYKVIDTMLIAKECFGFTSNKLEYMTDKLCKKYKKLKHVKFAGFDLWKQCLKGNPEAWDEMELYNKYDILSLEELFWVLQPWSRKLPNVNHYHDEKVSFCIRQGTT